MVLSVDVGYAEKSAHVKHTLLRVARDSEYVLDDPAPHVEFLEMSDYAKVYRLYVWFASFADKRIANDQLLSMVDAEFTQEGIVIPFPVAVELDRRLPQGEPAEARPSARGPGPHEGHRPPHGASASGHPRPSGSRNASAARNAVPSKKRSRASKRCCPTSILTEATTWSAPWCWGASSPSTVGMKAW